MAVALVYNLHMNDRLLRLKCDWLALLCILVYSVWFKQRHKLKNETGHFFLAIAQEFGSMCITRVIRSMLLSRFCCAFSLLFSSAYAYFAQTCVTQTQLTLKFLDRCGGDFRVLLLKYYISASIPIWLGELDNKIENYNRNFQGRKTFKCLLGNNEENTLNHVKFKRM